MRNIYKYTFVSTAIWVQIHEKERNDITIVAFIFALYFGVDSTF